MHANLKPVLASTALICSMLVPVTFAGKPAADTPKAESAPVKEVKPAEKRPVIQLAILLDTSNSMDGLIEQAKAQLWNIVNQFIAVKRDGQRPLLQVALFEYGNDRLPASENHIRLVLPLTDDLDAVSKELFALKTNGGEEYCGAVIKAAVERLAWSREAADLKVVFIAGNEPFTQGPINFRDTCKAAITRGIQVNTIFCGANGDGITTGWKDGAVLADGSYTSIDQNVKVADIPAPQDKDLAKLSEELNKTFVPFGKKAAEGAANQAAQDANAAALAPSIAAQRAATKASANYRNSAWCLIDHLDLDKVKLEDIKDEDLPENMRKMSMEQRKAHLAEKKKQREALQKQIAELNDARNKYVADERRKQAAEGKETLDKAVIDSVRKQAEAKKYEFEK